MRILHIIATPRGSESHSLRVSEAFLNGVREQSDDVTVDVVDLYQHDLPVYEARFRAFESERTISTHRISRVSARPPEKNVVSPEPSPMIAIRVGCGWSIAGRRPSQL